MRKVIVVFSSISIILILFNFFITNSVKAVETRENELNIYLDEIIGQEYYIKNVCSGKYLDVSGGIAANGTNVQQYEFNGTDSQRWMIALKPNTNNEVYILPRLGNDGYQYMYSLDISNASSEDGANAQIYEYNGTDAQTYTLEFNSDFNFKIKSKCSNYEKAISIVNQGFNNELNVVQKDISDSINQYWIFEPVVRDRNFGQKYALANYDNHLKTYPNLESAGGDCTNFASQCLLAQGIHMVDNWYIYKKNTMFESPSNVLTLSLTWDTGDPAPWINANDFKDYWGAYHVEKAVACTGDWLYNNIQSMYEETKLGVGDIIQLAYITGDGGLGSAHHTMVVSSVKSNNGKNVYHIAEHTNSAYDKSIEEIAKDNKNEYFIFYKFYD